MGKISYRAGAMLVNGDINLYRNTTIDSFFVTGLTSKPIVLNSINNDGFIKVLEKAKESITLFKTPSGDDLDTVLYALFQKKVKFGLNFDIWINYTAAHWFQIVHFFSENAAFASPPIRTGTGKAVSLKMEFSFPKADFKHADMKQGKWLDEEEWIR